ncbi:MAG: hypothetical protein IJX90_12685 [Blautia sp.]|nr:hypothetical protein [Blautia sp.]
MNVLVIDVGTSSMRGILYRESGEKVFTKQLRYQPVHGDDGEVEQDPSDFEESLLLILRAFSSRTELFGGRVDVISITSQRSAIIPVDVKGKPLMNAIMWQDTRNREVCRSLEEHNDEIRRTTGAEVNCVFSGGKMRYLAKEKPEIYEYAHKLLTIPEYLIHLMTGEYVTDYTYGSRSNLMDLASGTWSEEMLSLFGVNEDKLCRLQEPGAVSGCVTEAFAELSGIPAGTPVISAGGDQQCAALGQGAFREGVLTVVTGTGAFLMTTCDRLPEKIPAGLICNASAVPGKYVLEANVLTCCSAFDWFLRTFYDWEQPDYDWVNDQLLRLREQNDGCLVLPYFQGRSAPFWNPGARAGFTGISLHTTREEMLKGMLEGIFMEIANNIEAFLPFAKISGASISGGLTKSRVMNQMQADVYGIPLVHYQDPESTANGAFMAAMHRMTGIGYETIFERLCSLSEREDYTPDPEKNAWYRDRISGMNRLYERIS